MNVTGRDKETMAKVGRKPRWTKDSIPKAIDDYLLQNGRLPSTNELAHNNNLPHYFLIKKVYGLTTKQFYNTYYTEYVNMCQSSKYHYHDTKYWLNDFIKRFKELNYPSQSFYDQHRDSSPSSQHLIKLAKVHTWGELLIKCGCDKKNQYKLETKIVNADNIDYEKMYKSLEAAIKSINLTIS